MIFRKSPSVQVIFARLLKRTWTHPNGTEIKVTCAMVDSGHKTKSVYSFTKKRERLKIYAAKGHGGSAIPIIARPTRQGVERAALFSIGTDTCKDLIYSRIKTADLGPGYMHFPSDRPEDWFKQLTSEVKVTRYVNGVAYSKFENPSKARNEALDCRVYALAALHLLRINWKTVAKSFKMTDEEITETVVADIDKPTNGKRKYQLKRSWVNDW